MSEAEHEAAGAGGARHAGGGAETGSSPAQQANAGPPPQSAARGAAQQMPGREGTDASAGQFGAYPAQGAPGYAAQHQAHDQQPFQPQPHYQPQFQPQLQFQSQYPLGHHPGYQPQYHSQQVAHGQGGYGDPYPGPAMGAPAYSSAYAPHQAAGYPPPGYQAYSAGAMPHQGAPTHQGSPMGAHAAGMAGAGQGPGPQAGMQQLFEELAEGGNGLNTLTRMLSLDDTELWKGALVGAAAVLLLTNDQVQDALFKSGAKAKGAVKSGADTLKERMSTASEKEGDA